MGFQKNVYIGAYATLFVDDIETDGAQVCPKCRNSTAGGDFCSRCGTAATRERVFRRPYLCEVVKSDERIMSAFLDVEIENNPDIVLIPQSTGVARIPYDESGSATALAPEDIGRCIREFEGYYMEELEILRPKVIGVSVRFGVVSYWV